MKVRHHVITVGWNRHRRDQLKVRQLRRLSRPRHSVVWKHLSYRRDRLRVRQLRRPPHPRHSAVWKYLSHPNS